MVNIVKGRCRGEGKLFSLLDIRYPGNLEVNASLRDGRVLPARVVRLNITRFVLILPDVDAFQHVTYSIQYRKRSSGKTGSFVIRPRLFELASKINGVFRKGMCSKIRNKDSSGLDRQISLSVDRLIPTGDGILIRGHVIGSSIDEVAGVRAFDLRGEPLATTQGFLNESPRFLDATQDSQCEFPFSINVTRAFSSLGLTAFDEKGEDVGSFLCFKQDLLFGMFENSFEYYTDAFNSPMYGDWISSRRITGNIARLQRAKRFDIQPRFSLIVPLYKTPLQFFKEMADSVIAQTYSNWELVLVNSTPNEIKLKELVQSYAERDDRIQVIDLTRNYGITENTNKGIAVSNGDYLCFFDHDDVLEPNILFDYAEAINEKPDVDLLYCDEDKLYPDGKFRNPCFKPDFSLDLLRDNNYICHMLSVRRGALESIAPSAADLDGAQDHALALKIAELGGSIVHIPRVLYHWRTSENSTASNANSKPYATEAGIKAVQQHLERLGVDGRVSCSHGRAFRYRVDYELPENKKASVIVPSRGDIWVLSGLFESLEQIEYPEWELILLVDGSLITKARKLVQHAKLSATVRILTPEFPFAYASWMNYGARRATGACLVFAHDDIRPENADWLRVLAGFAFRNEVGAVGTMCCNTDGTIQQAGISHVEGNIVELSSGLHKDVPGYIFMPLSVRNVAAVGGACLATSREAFERIEGFDEAFLKDYADIDYCFSADAAGLKVVYTPEACVQHYASTGLRFMTNHRSAQHHLDKSSLLRKWAGRFAAGDVFFSPNFSSDPREAALYKLDNSDKLCRIYGG